MEIQQVFIVGMKFMQNVKRQGFFGYHEVEGDCKDKYIIDTSIKQKLDNRYFDKYGNEFTIDEILTGLI